MAFGNVLGQQTDLSQYATESWVNQQIQKNAGGWTQICQWIESNKQTYNFNGRLPCAFKLVIFDVYTTFNAGGAFSLNINDDNLDYFIRTTVPMSSNKNISIILPFMRYEYASTGKWTGYSGLNIKLQLNPEENSFFLYTNSSLTKFSSALLYAMF